MKKTILIASLSLLLVPALLAQEAAPEPNPWLFLPNLRIFGADLGVGYRTPADGSAPDTIFWIFLGGGYEWPTFYRDPNNHLYNGDFPGFNPATSPLFTRVNLKIDLGIAQGILFNDRINANLLEAFLFYRARYDATIDDAAANELIVASDRPDRMSLYQNSVIAGFSYNDLDLSDRHLIPNGWYAEISAEWGPDFIQTVWLNPEAKADFLRFDAQAKLFIPLFDLDPDAELNTFSGCFAGFASIDYSMGNNIPINIQQSFGGRFARSGLGGSVRGYELTRFDGLFKAVINLEARFNLWQFELIDVVTPGFVVFFDAGYYNFVYYPESGFLFSTGIGIFLNVWKFTSLSAYTVLVFDKPLATGGYWAPLVFSFAAHF